MNNKNTPHFQGKRKLFHLDVVTQFSMFDLNSKFETKEQATCFY